MSMPRRTVAGVVAMLAGLAAVILAGCGSDERAVTTAAPGGGGLPAVVHDQQAATQVATALLGRVALPPGALRVASPPAPELRSAPQRQDTPDLAQATVLARTVLAPSQVVAYWQLHPPIGMTPDFSGEGSLGVKGTTAVQYLADNIGGMPPGVVHATLLLSVAPASGGRTGMRVDAQVVWVPAKPAYTNVPAGDDTAFVAVEETLPPRVVEGEHLPALRRDVVTAPARLDALRAAADGLTMPVPGPMSCPADLGTRSVVTFARYVVAFARGSASPPNITFTTGACALVRVSVPGHPVVTLFGAGRLMALVSGSGCTVGRLVVCPAPVGGAPGPPLPWTTAVPLQGAAPAKPVGTGAPTAVPVGAPGPATRATPAATSATPAWSRVGPPVPPGRRMLGVSAGG
jgi:hypothetical protein